ncbi:MAG: hypothetical protein AB1555_06365 [Nitrospirota bacterium]
MHANSFPVAQELEAALGTVLIARQRDLPAGRPFFLSERTALLVLKRHRCRKATVATGPLINGQPSLPYN